MNAAIKLSEKLPNIQLPTAMKWALAGSVVFHLVFVIAGTVGLPHIKKPIVINQPIAIEIVNIDEETTTNKKPNPIKQPKAEEKPAPKKEPIKAPPKVETKAPPKVTPLEPPKVVENKVKPKPKTPPPPSEKLEKPKEEKSEPKEDKVEEAAAQEQAFLSVLKNLQETEPAASEEPDAPADKPTPEQASPLARFAQQLSATEVDAIRMALNRQFGECWNLMAGARYAEDIIVQIRLVINPDRTVQSARINDQWRYTQDSFYKAAADTALRAVSHPNCAVLDLPPDKYDLWKDMIFNFNPSAQL